jgi:hypothetical protein
MRRTVPKRQRLYDKRVGPLLLDSRAAEDGSTRAVSRGIRGSSISMRDRLGVEALDLVEWHVVDDDKRVVLLLGKHGFLDRSDPFISFRFRRAGHFHVSPRPVRQPECMSLARRAGFLLDQQTKGAQTLWECHRGESQRGLTNTICLLILALIACTVTCSQGS